MVFYWLFENIVDAILGLPLPTFTVVIIVLAALRIFGSREIATGVLFILGGGISTWFFAYIFREVLGGFLVCKVLGVAFCIFVDCYTVYFVYKFTKMAVKGKK